MPFYTKQPSAETLHAEPIIQDQPPLFIFPGVLGNKSELKNLVDQLYKKINGKREIYVYNDPRLELEQDSSFLQNLSMEEQVKLILSEMPGVPFAPFPYLIVGNSQSCSVVGLLASYLLLHGHEPHVCLIDGPSTLTAKKYINNQPASFASDLIHILNYAAQLSALRTHLFSTEEIELITKHSLDEQFDAITKTIITSQQENNSENLAQFHQYTSIAKQNLKNTFSGGDCTYTLPKINLILTNETLSKYASPYCGWDAYAKEINLINNEELANQNHMSLLSEKNHNCTKLAELILEAFNKEVKKEDAFVMELIFCLKQYKKNNPDVDVAKILTYVLKIMKQEQENGLSPSTQITINDHFMDLDNESSIGPGKMTIEQGETQQSTKNRQQFGLFPNMTTIEVDDYAPNTYNTRNKARERAERLNSPAPHSAKLPSFKS